MVAFPRAQILDVVGPLEVFAATNEVLDSSAGDERSAARPRYAIELAATRKTTLEASGGLRLAPDRALRDVRGPIDSLLIAGGQGTREALEDDALLRFLARRAPDAGRVASVCTGAFLLAAAGLLHGRRVTTHWSQAERLQERHPELQVEPDRIFVRDDPIWTSAGVTAGMDLALALVEEDCGREVALTVARHLVLFLRRPGGQSQFSAQLETRVSARAPLREIQTYAVEHPEADLSVDRLAARAGMSPRHFARVFVEQVGLTPARYVETVRIEAARRRLEESDAAVEAIAAECGFGTAETMRRAFLRRVCVSPSDYRNRFERRPERRGMPRGPEARPHAGRRREPR